MCGVSTQLQPVKGKIREQGRDWAPSVKSEGSSIWRPAAESTSLKSGSTQLGTSSSPCPTTQNSLGSDPGIALFSPI